MSDLILQKNIRKGLANKLMSVSELERHCGLKHSAIQNILHGRSKSPSISIIKSIAEGFGCSIEQLLSDDMILSNKSKSNSPPKTVTQAIWQPKLFIKCLLATQEAFEQKGIVPSFDQAIASATEVYNYTINASTEIVDDRFVEWLIERFY